jgi:hypothetical protein
VWCFFVVVVVVGGGGGFVSLCGLVSLKEGERGRGLRCAFK